MPVEKEKPIIFFDGYCNLCNYSVQQVLKNDPEGKFKLASLQGKTAATLLSPFQAGASSGTFVLWDNGKAFTKSDAALRVSRSLGGGFRLLYVLRILPRGLRNAVYDLISRNRYKWFGKRSECMMPKPEWNDRFLD